MLPLRVPVPIYQRVIAGILLCLIFYTLSFGVWVKVAVEYNLSSDFAWVTDGVYGPCVG